MNVHFVGDARFIGGEDALEVDVQIDGAPVVCVVTAGALRELSRDRIDPDNAARICREQQGFLRDVILEKVCLDGGRMPDRMTLDAADVRDRGY